ncbi:Uncharacterised protein [Mycolicibacterium thermoresistibile]|nr:Uncharacterised protein [Mycolicibacterium thermoresistibile]
MRWPRPSPHCGFRWTFRTSPSPTVHPGIRPCAGYGDSAPAAATVRRPRRECAGRGDSAPAATRVRQPRRHAANPVVDTQSPRSPHTQSRRRTLTFTRRCGRRRGCTRRTESALATATVRRPRRECTHRGESAPAATTRRESRRGHTITALTTHSKQTSHTRGHTTMRPTSRVHTSHRERAGYGDSAPAAARVHSPRRQCAGRDDSAPAATTHRESRRGHTITALTTHSKQTSHTQSRRRTLIRSQIGGGEHGQREQHRQHRQAPQKRRPHV